MENLRAQLNYHPIGYNLLHEKITIPELQKLEETKKGVAHKAPYYHKFNLRKYQKALQSGMGFEL